MDLLDNHSTIIISHFHRLSASPLRQLAKDSSLVESWPPTMIIHGMLDGIVPVEHSFHFLSSLVVKGSHLSASRNLERESSGNINSASHNVTGNHLNSKNKDGETKKSFNFEKNEDKKVWNELKSRDGDEKLLLEGLVHLSEKAITAPCTDTLWAIREQDAIVTLPGAKHSFEAIGGEVVDIVCEGVINWLSKGIQ